MMKIYIKYLFIVCVLLSLTFCEKEISVSPPDEPPPNGKIILETEPPGFKIYLDEKYRIRETPDSLTWLDNGVYNIRLEKEFFTDTSFAVEIINRERKELYLNLNIQSVYGQLSITSEPENAEIYLNDSNTTQRTPHTFELLPGRYDVTLKLEDHRDFTYKDTVKTGVSKTGRDDIVLVDTTAWEEYSRRYGNIGNNEFFNSVVVDHNDLVWIGTTGRSVYTFDGSNWNFLVTGYSTLPSRAVRNLAVDDLNKVWMLTYNGLSIANNGVIETNFYSGGSTKEDGSRQATGFDTDLWLSASVSKGFPYYFGTDLGVAVATGPHSKGGNYVNWEFNSFTNSELGISASISDIWQNENGEVIVGTSHGIFLGSEVTSQNYNESNSNIARNNVSSISGSNEGIWIGHGGFLSTEGSAYNLSFFDGNNIQTLKLNDTLDTFSPVYDVFVDSRNIKWIATFGGIYAFYDFTDRVFIGYDNSGLRFNSISDFAEDSKGHIWISTNRGLFRLKNVEKYLR